MYMRRQCKELSMQKDDKSIQGKKMLLLEDWLNIRATKKSHCFAKYSAYVFVEFYWYVFKSK